MCIPAGSGGGVESSSGVGAGALSLVRLIAALGRPRMPRDEGSGPTRLGWGRLQHMSGCRRRMQRPWDRGRRAPPIGAAGAAGYHCQGGNRMDDRRLVGIDLGITSAHTVRVLAGDGSLVCRRKAIPTVDSLEQVEQAALAETPAGTLLEVVLEPTGPAWLPIAVFFAARGHIVYRVSSA